MRASQTCAVLALRTAFVFFPSAWHVWPSYRFPAASRSVFFFASVGAGAHAIISERRTLKAWRAQRAALAQAAASAAQSCRSSYDTAASPERAKSAAADDM